MPLDTLMKSLYSLALYVCTWKNFKTGWRNRCYWFSRISIDFFRIFLFTLYCDTFFAVVYKYNCISKRAHKYTSVSSSQPFNYSDIESGMGAYSRVFTTCLMPYCTCGFSRSQGEPLMLSWKASLRDRLPDAATAAAAGLLRGMSSEIL